MEENKKPRIISEQRIVLLDIIRTAAITLVIAAHIFQSFGVSLGNDFGVHNFYWGSIGGVGVTIFLILSGIVLQLKYSDKIISYRDFILKRISTIYPTYYLCLIVGVLLYIAYNYVVPNALSSSAYNFFELITLSLTGFFAFAGAWGGPFINTSWYIGPIVSLYFLFLPTSKLIKKNPLVGLALLFIISFISRYILGQYNILPNRAIDWFPLCRIFEFGLGMYLAETLEKNAWHCLDNLKATGNGFFIAAKISFPLFLVHAPLLPLMKYFSLHTNKIFAALIYIIISCFISWVIIKISDRFTNKKMLYLYSAVIITALISVS